ncbi:MAG: hypothetical protein KDH88_17680 [Chromatiales bacterium]|nr:hypothetical protein [Chromatiales bacterium]
MMRPVAHFLLVLFLGLGLSACSTIKFGYDQLDWLIPYYTGDYLDLNADQEAYLDRAVGDLLVWHCGDHLGAYAELLRDTNREFLRRGMDEAAFNRFVDRLGVYWKEIKRKVAPNVVHLLLSSNQDQIDEFLARLAKENEELLEEYQEKTEQEQREERLTLATKHLERWLGPLREDQRKAVKAWNWQFVPYGRMRVQAREDWRQSVGELLQNRADRVAFEAGLTRLFVDSEMRYSIRYLRIIEANRSLTVQMLAEVTRLMGRDQIEHLVGEAGALADDLDSLVCRDS